MRALLQAVTHPRDARWGLRPWTRHSLVLLVGGVVYVQIGITYLTSEATSSRHAALATALLVMPLPWWGVVWMVVGVAAVASSRWPPASETWGYAGLNALAAWWSACYAFGVLMGAPNQSISGAYVWGLVAFLWWAVAGLANPSPKPVAAPLVVVVDDAGPSSE